MSLMGENGGSEGPAAEGSRVARYTEEPEACMTLHPRRIADRQPVQR